MEKGVDLIINMLFYKMAASTFIIANIFRNLILFNLLVALSLHHPDYLME
jgi:hypothetical protein